MRITEKEIIKRSLELRSRSAHLRIAYENLRKSLYDMIEQGKQLKKKSELLKGWMRLLEKQKKHLDFRVKALEKQRQKKYSTSGTRPPKRRLS